MDFRISPEQGELRDAVRDVLDRECPPSFVRSVVEGATPADALWRTIVELGWPALVVDEEHGGLGLGFTELVLVIEEMGRHVLPGPFLPTVTQFLPAIRTLDAARTEAVAAGELTGSLAVGPVDSARRWVVDGDIVDEVVVAKRPHGGDAVALFVVSAAELGATVPDPLDRSRHHSLVDLDTVTLPPDRVLTLDGADVLQRAVEEATVALAAEMVGACQALFDLTVAHVKVREQFGVPIGSFQAVKHKLADVYVALERARSTTYYAAMTIAEDDPRRRIAASMAKAAAGDAARLLVRDGIQLQGGVAYTWEHDTHLYVKRLMASAALLGTAEDHRREIAEALLSRS